MCLSHTNTFTVTPSQMIHSSCRYPILPTLYIKKLIHSHFCFSCCSEYGAKQLRATYSGISIYYSALCLLNQYISHICRHSQPRQQLHTLTNTHTHVHMWYCTQRWRYLKKICTSLICPYEIDLDSKFFHHINL